MAWALKLHERKGILKSVSDFFVHRTGFRGSVHQLDRMHFVRAAAPEQPVEQAGNEEIADRDDGGQRQKGDEQLTWRYL